MTPKSPRTAAAEAIRRILGGGAYSNIAINGAIEGIGGNISDRALCVRIVMTAVERAKTLDFIIDGFCKKKPDPMLRALLFTGAVQILFMERIPDSAACDETVKAAKELTDEYRAKFVNAVLRNICRSKEKIAASLETAPEDIRYSIDPTILALLKTQYPENIFDIIQSFFCEQPLFVVPNLIAASRSDVEAILTEAGCETGSKDGFLYVASGASKALAMIDRGAYYVQGYASQYAVRMLGARPGERVIDVCACPGGKTFGAAIDMKNSGEIFAFDLHKNKLSLIEKTAEKLGITIIHVREHDGRNAVDALKGSADRVICDVPCSALGVIASRPEIRYKNVSDLSSLISTQYGILCASAEYLKIGGTLVYSTCTFNCEENIKQIERFTREHSGYEVAEMRQFLPDGFTDGFFCCRIIKNG